MDNWQIPEEDTFSTEERRRYWEKLHSSDNYRDVWSLTDAPEVRNTVCQDLAKVQPCRQVLIPGCGSKTLLQNQIAESFPELHSIVCTDYEGVVATAASQPNHKKIVYKAKDSASVDWQQHFDSVIIVNSVISESDRENRAILRACRQALRPGGCLIGFFPTSLCTLDLGYLEQGPERKRILERVNPERSTVYETNQGITQIFYTPLRLRYLLKNSGFSLDRMQVFFCDSDYFVDATYCHYKMGDRDKVIYELFVVASAE
jgi:SAM-dependent methyltransferase